MRDAVATSSIATGMLRVMPEGPPKIRFGISHDRCDSHFNVKRAAHARIRACRPQGGLHYIGQCTGGLLTVLWIGTRVVPPLPVFSANTPPDTPVKEGGKACLERRCERVEGAEADADHPAAPPADDAGHRPDVPQHAHQPLAL
jgi:hypothetical protein